VAETVVPSDIKPMDTGRQVPTFTPT